MFLRELLRHKRLEIAREKKKCSLNEIKKQALRQKRKKDGRFKSALAGKGKLHLICELKKASPSAGTLKSSFNPAALAKTFERAGASALSVLTERRYFKGRPEFLTWLKRKTRLPLLRKDFIVDEYQVYETALLGADAVLLIVTILTDKELRRLIRLAQTLKLDALVEVHTKKELSRALRAKANLIGINNRNLRTLQVNPWNARRLLPKVPKRAVLVVESGIETAGHIRAYRHLGVHNFLIGTALMKSKNIAAKIKELKGKTDAAG